MENINGLTINNVKYPFDTEAWNNKNDKITIVDDDTSLTDIDTFNETASGTNPTTIKRRAISLLWSYIKSKITGAVTTIITDNITESRALISNIEGKIAASNVTSTELSYLSGVTNSVQAQLNDKVPITRKVNGYALSSDAIITKSDIGLGSVTNYDQSKAIQKITRSGNKFTATALDGTTSTFDQQTDYKIYFHDCANFSSIEKSGFYKVKATADDAPSHDADVSDIAHFCLSTIDESSGLGFLVAFPITSSTDDHYPAYTFTKKVDKQWHIGDWSFFRSY